KDSVRRMANHFSTLLESFAKNPQRKIQEMELLTAAEKHQLLNDWSRGGTIVWNGETIIDLLESRAKQTPDATALVLAETSAGPKNARLTYRELMTRASERACALIQAGVTPGAAVGALLPRSLEIVVSMIAI